MQLSIYPLHMHCHIEPYHKSMPYDVYNAPSLALGSEVLPPIQLGCETAPRKDLGGKNRFSNTFLHITFHAMREH